GWSVFVGLVFSTIGAAGGILAGVGHISILGIAQANTVRSYEPGDGPDIHTGRCTFLHETETGCGYIERSSGYW
ncbi:MAG: hypothetical protein Q9N34_10410, partial [Aquificota bacterium]|nr:hypothetical protein [Aquificota bacterium]